MECVLHGVILDSSKDALIQKLKSVFMSVDVPFFHRELVYSAIAPAVGSSGGPIAVEVRVRIDPSSKSKILRLIAAPAVVKTKSPVTLRNVSEVKVSNNIEGFLESIGFKYNYEYIREGSESYGMVNDRKYTMIISKIKKANGEDIDETTSSCSMVELITENTGDENLNEAAEDINSFAECFYPLVELAKLELPRPMPPQPPAKRPLGVPGPTPGMLQGTPQVPTKQVRLVAQFPPFGMQ